MKKHTKVYYNAFGYHETDFIPSEWSGGKAIDIHHIVGRENRIENLMALTRLEHLEYGDKKRYMLGLLKKHEQAMKDLAVDYDTEYYEALKAKYDGWS